MSQHDDGTRATAVAQIGEEAVIAAEVETVTQYAHMGAAFFARLGIPETSIRTGLAAAGKAV